MSLTGHAFFILLIAVTVVAVVTTLALWGRVRGPQAVRTLLRLGMIALCQATAIAVVAVWINNANGLYTSWGDLFGDDGTATVTGPTAAQAVFSNQGQGAELQTVFHGERSGVTGQVIVWTPPQYRQARYRDDRFPVMMLLHGVPSSPEAWIKGGDVLDALQSMMTTGEVRPAVVVIPTIDANNIDTDCSDTPRQKNATWLVDDVRELVEQRFRVQDTAHGWSLTGFSTGGLCAVKLAMQYPKDFASAAGMSPDDFYGDKGVLTNAHERERNSPMWLASRHPAVSLLVATSARDRYSTVANAEDLAHAVRWPTVMAPPVVLKDGGHNWGTWRSLFPTVFPWMSQHLTPPGVVTETDDGSEAPHPPLVAHPRALPPSDTFPTGARPPADTPAPKPTTPGPLPVADDTPARLAP